MDGLSHGAVYQTITMDHTCGRQFFERPRLLPVRPRRRVYSQNAAEDGGLSVGGAVYQTTTMDHTLRLTEA